MPSLVRRSFASLTCIALCAGLTAFAVEPPATTPTKPEKAVPEKTKEVLKEKADKAQKQAKQSGEKALEQAKHDGEKTKDAIVSGKAELNKPAPTFTLTDTDGNTVTLASVLADKKNIVVLEWFNPDCPFVKLHHDKQTTFKDMAKAYAGKPVKFFAINSGGEGKQGHGLDRNKKARTEYGMTYPVLLDPTGAVGKAYGAKTTPHMYILNKDGVLAYMGAIDNYDTKSQTKATVNHVSKALDELLAGGSVTTNQTTPYGCSVKYN